MKRPSEPNNRPPTPYEKLVDELRVSIGAKVREMQREGIVGMSEDNLRAVVKPPVLYHVPNPVYFYRRAFHDALAGAKLRAFEIIA